jgi:hypothetical protein
MNSLEPLNFGSQGTVWGDIGSVKKSISLLHNTAPAGVFQPLVKDGLKEKERRKKTDRNTQLKYRKRPKHEIMWE